MGRLDGKVAAVTGGASGIGEATVRRFIAQGASVAFCDRDGERGQRVAAELESAGAKIAFTHADVGTEAACLAFVNGAAQRFGRLDILINNAGIRKYEKVDEASAASWNEILNVNLMRITLTSHTPDCRGVRPPTAAPAEWAETPDELSRRALLARTANRYLDPERTKYVHLLDGGISDNLALRGVANGGIALDDTTDSFRRVAMTTRRVLVLSVDGQSASDPAISKQRVVTGLSQIFGAVSGTQIDAYNFETLILTAGELRQLVESLRKVRCAQARVIEGHDCADVRGALVHISLASIPDPQERQRLQAIPTGLTIPDEDVDLLVSSGERLVQQNDTIRGLISDLDGPAVAVTAKARPRWGAR